MGDGQPAKPKRRATKIVERTAIDVETGTVLQLEWQEPVLSRRPKDARQSEPFAIAFPSGMRQLAKMDLTGADWAVLLQLVGHMAFEDAFKYRTGELADELGMKAQNVSRSIRRLTDRNILIPRGPRMTLINPDYFWRGRIAQRLAMLHRLAAETTKNRSGSAAKEGSARAEP